MRRVPIDFADIARQSGLRRGRLCKTPFGWAVQNTHGEDGPNLAVINPPAMMPGEKSVWIRDNHWEFMEDCE